MLAAFVAVGLALRLPLMGDSIWFDEACMSNQRIGTWEQLVATIYVDIHPPLYVVFMHYWNSLFGDGEWSMRLPALIVGLASIPMTFVAGRRLVGDTAALWAAALLTLSPAHVWYSAEARLYSLLVFSTLLLVYTFQRLLDDSEQPTWRLWLLHLANLAVMLSLHYYLALYVVLLAALAPVAARGLQGQANRILIWHGIGLILLAAFILAKQYLGEFETSQDYLRRMSASTMFDLLFAWTWSGNTLRADGSSIGLACAWTFQIIAMALTAIGLGQLWRQRAERPFGLAVPLYALTIPVFLLVSAWVGLGNTYIERSCLPSLPFLLLIGGAGLASLPRRIHLAAGGAVLLLTAAALVAMFGYRQTHWTVYKPNPDWRGAAAWLGEQIDRGGSGRAVYTSTPNPRPLSYYDSRIQDVRSLRPATDPTEIGHKVEDRLGTWFGEMASDTFTSFAAQQQRLLDGARLRVYPSAGDPSQLEPEARASGDVCYVVRNEWHPHPSIDSSVEDLLSHPLVEVLETARFHGMTVYKVRITQ